MKTKLFLFGILLVASTISFCQSKVTLYYNENFELTTLEKSKFRREAKLDFSEMVFDGDFADYDKENKLIRDGQYTKGEISGVHHTYNDGVVQSDVDYSGDEFVINELVDFSGKSTITNRTGHFSIPFRYFENFYEFRKWRNGTLEGEFKNGKRFGMWKYVCSENNVTYEEQYNENVLERRVGISKRGPHEFKTQLKVFLSNENLEIEKFNFDKTIYKNLQQYFEQYPPDDLNSIQRNAVYPGGTRKLLSLIALSIKYPKEDLKTGKQGQVIVSLTIDEHGIVKQKKIIKSVSPTMDKEAIRVLEEFESKLCPAIQAGKPYEYILSIPIRFNIVQ